MIDIAHPVLVGFIVILGFLIFFLPMIIAFARQHPRIDAIATLSCFLAWIPGSWVIGLILAVIPLRLLGHRNPPNSAS